VANFAESAVTSLRKQGSLALELAVFAMTNRFKEAAPQATGGVCVPLPDATDDHRTFLLAALDGCRRLYRPGYAYKKAGVVITKLLQADGYTRSLFEDAESAGREARLSASIDAIHRHFGSGALLFGAQGDGKIRNAREHQSPHYTTLWADIPKVTVK
jgi:DNA polymerase V